MKLNVDVRQLTVPKKIELSVAVLLLLYATVGIYYLKDSSAYMDFFDIKAVRMVTVGVVCAVGYANPRLGVLLAVCLFRTVNVVAERFDVLELDPKKTPDQLIGTDGSLSKLTTPGRFPTEDLDKGQVQVFEKAGDDTERVTSDLMGLGYNTSSDDPNATLSMQFGLSMAAPPSAGSSAMAADLVAVSAPSVSQAVVVEPAADQPMISAENADDVTQPAPGVSAYVPAGSAQPAVTGGFQLPSVSEMASEFGW